MDLLGGPAADVAATVQEDFEQADDARIMELDAGIADRADKAIQQIVDLLAA